MFRSQYAPNIGQQVSEADIELESENSMILNNMPTFFEHASFDFIKENDNIVLCHLHIGDVVSVNIKDEDNFAIIRAIFCHQKDDR
ncbi:hypothetical protein C1645_837319 [Glomus cerebriforme]|uniref:Uncharacterized protein n=1 Tax=Glomus cerebriforme TaxID=658196 RepID=A0A397S8U4_9GLOM|nr:hypothetical protein C1645_837319 [Glomus cerebriforme]